MQGTDAGFVESNRIASIKLSIKTEYDKWDVRFASAYKPLISNHDVSKYPELQKACIEEAKPFGEFQDCIDEDGHGSLTAAMVNKVNPHVELFIAKIFRNTKHVEPQNISFMTELRIFPFHLTSI